MEGQDVKGRSRASSTSSYGREVRCGCQYFQSDSLLPERRAMMMRPSSRNANPMTTSGTCDHEYEPVGAAWAPRTMAPATAPVVRIIDTDVVPVADSDDSIDVKGRFTPGPVLDDDDVVLPLDGQIEDNAMEARELGSGDTSDDLEHETAQQLQDRLEERFLNTATPGTESRTDGEVNTSQVDSSVMEELPLRRGARGLPQRLRSQAGKLRSRIKGIQRPHFTFPIERKKSPKVRSSERSKSSDKTRSSEKSKSPEGSRKRESTKDKPSRIDRIRSSLPDRPKFSLPDKSKFPNFPKLPSRSSFHLPNLPGRRKTPSLGEQQRQHSSESTAGSRRNIFDFSTVPRLFDRKSKEHGEYATSSPKDSRAQSSESTTLPRVKKSKTSLGSRWTARFTDIKLKDEQEIEKPWKHPNLEKPRLSLRGQESVEDSEPIAWIDEHRASIQDEGLPYDLQGSKPEIIEETTIPKLSKIIHRDSEESYEPEPPQIDPRMYGDQDVARLEREELQREVYRVSFGAVDPQDIRKKRLPSSEGRDSENEGGVGMDDREPEEEDRYSTEPEDESAPSDREQQASSGSSYERRRRGVIEEIDSDEIFVRVKGISQDDMTVAKYLTSEIREALRAPGNALADEIIVLESPPQPPPRRPARKRNLRQRKEESLESIENIPPNRPKRILRRSEESDYGSNIIDNSDSLSGSHHRIVYHAESAPMDLSHVEPLDDIIVVKPLRRKSRSSLRSSSLVPSEPILEISPEVSPPPVPQRRKRRAREVKQQINGIESCNGHHTPELDSWRTEITRPQSEPPVKPARMPSRETVNIITQVEDDYIEPQAELDLELEVEHVPIPPKRRSRSRGTSIFQDDDVISRGAESLDVAYIDDEEEDNERVSRDNDTDSRGNFPGYAVIDKKEKPPRPAPPRRRRDKFATTPRRSSGPLRPQRAYSTLRPRSYDRPEEDRVTPYDEIDPEEGNGLEDIDGEHLRELMSGQVMMKMAGRPLPAPPRPIRTKGKDKAQERRDEEQDLPTYASSTQTDPLPDDMVIEEEIIQARAVITPSLTGSQILVSTERIPTPRPFQITAISHEEIPSLDHDVLRGTSTRSEPELARKRRDDTPERDFDVPDVPPLPSQKISSEFPDVPPQRPPRTRSQSLSVRGDDTHDPRITAIEELEERLTALLTSETFKIANLEVGDLRVDKLSVSTLEAHKIAVSELDAIVVSASEITCAEDDEPVINPSLLRELVAIRNQLEAVAASQPQSSPGTPFIVSEDSPSDSKTESTIIEVKESRAGSPKRHQLQLEPLSKSMETRALYSSQGSEQVPIREIHHQVESTKDVSPTSSKSTSRADSPMRTTTTGALISRETASPVRSLPPAISVTPDTVEPSAPLEAPTVPHKKFETSQSKPQRATISYSAETSPESPESLERSSPIPPQFIAFQTSQIPPQFFALSSPQVQTPQPAPNSGNDEPGVIDMTQQLLRALRLAGKRAMRHFVSYVVSRVSQEETEAKIREVELTLCALLLIIAGLLIVCFAAPRTINHHHHWDYFNPPRL
ncbi:titin [Diachasma alloeum]|uniref:titin n=1 Tax=Diachasma alloeum TaxID=454923 RepID=UPI00073850CA|nr:titin [Diachasma alloeum]